MQTVSDIMSRDAAVVAPGETLQRAAQLMGELDVGALPVWDGTRLVGMVTDRDLAVRGFGAGLLPQEATVDQIMSGDVRYAFEDQPLDELMAQMGDSQVRRIPVLSHDAEQRLVGIVSLGDLATRTPPEAKADAQDVTELVSRPTDAAIPPLDGIVGQGGEVSGAAAAGTPLAGPAGVDLPEGGGEGSMGVGGGSGQAAAEGSNGRTGHSDAGPVDPAAGGPGRTG